MGRKDSEYNLSSREEDDPYAQFAKQSESTLNDTTKETARSRKWRQFRSKLTEAKGTMQTGFMMGCIVGGGFGGIVGLYYAISHRSFLILPVSIVSSGLSFGFFLMCGSLIRSSDYKSLPYSNSADNRVLSYNLETGQYNVSEKPIWMLKN